MKVFVGKVTEVFLPDNKIDPDLIGFKVLCNKEIIEVIQKQNMQVSKIFKGDVVLVTENVIDGQTFRDIEIFDGDLDD